MGMGEGDEGEGRVGLLRGSDGEVAK